MSRQTLHAWLAKYEAGGIENLGDRSHRPRSCPHQMPPAVEVAVAELRRAHPTWGPKRLVYELDKKGIRPLPSVAGVYRALVRLGLIDPAARFCVSAHLMMRESSRNVCEGLAAALRAYGVPAQILTDIGKVFTGRFGKPVVEVLFDRICRENGIEHLLTQPRSPTTTGKVERFHRSLRTEFRTDRVFASLEHAQAELDEWVTDYNHRRPHQSIGMVTPAERFFGDEAAAPVPIRSHGDAVRPGPDRGDGTWVARRASKVGVVSVNWQQVCLGAAAAGRNIDVWVTEQVVQFFDGDQLLRTEQRRTTGEVRKKRASLPGGQRSRRVQN